MADNGKANGTLIHPTDAEQKAKEEAWTSLAQEARTEASPSGAPLIIDIPCLTAEQAQHEANTVKALEKYGYHVVRTRSSPSVRPHTMTSSYLTDTPRITR